MNKIIKAALFAAKKHEGQFRKYNNLPYISHVIRVAGRFMTHADSCEDSICSAWLHDVAEDCYSNPQQGFQEIERLFGDNVRYGVEYLTNVSKQTAANRAKRKQMDCERISNIPVKFKIIKLIDRIDNLREVDRAEDFSKKYAQESKLLANSLKNVDSLLEQELEQIIQDILV